MALEREDWLLILLALRNAEERLDAVRLQTGMFLLSKDQGAVSSLYEYQPSDPGPFSATIYSDLASLEDRQLVAREPVGGFSWSEFVITEKGLERARELVEGFEAPQVAALRELARIKTEVLSKSFRDLLDYLHREHPEFARNSSFR